MSRGRAADDAAALAASLGGGGGGDDCQGFAGALYGAFFADAAAALLEAHPPGALDGDGRPFWAGTRLPPTPAAALFDATDESDPAPAFLDATAALRRTSLGLAAAAPARLSDAVARLEASLARLAAAGGRAGVGLDALRGRVAPQVFDKDDVAAGHVAWVAAAANARAKVFGLPRADELRCKQIAGKVVPAIATTTAVVSGLAVFEAAKILAGLGGDVARLRSTFVHLGAPLWGQAEPGPVNEWRLPGGGTATEWTVPAVRLAAADTVVDLVAKLEVDLFPGASVRSLVVRDESETLLYLRALHDGDEGARSWTVRERLRVLDAAPAAGHLDLLVTGDDGEGGELDVPPVRVHIALA